MCVWNSTIKSAIDFIVLSHQVVLEKADAIGCSTVSGTIFVKNLEFEKRVSVKYTTDGWKTHSFCEAAFVMPGDQPGIRWALEPNPVVGSTDEAQSWDQFSFT